jgi:hypothetical protein
MALYNMLTERIEMAALDGKAVITIMRLEALSGLTEQQWSEPLTQLQSILGTALLQRRFPVDKVWLLSAPTGHM